MSRFSLCHSFGIGHCFERIFVFDVEYSLSMSEATIVVAKICLVEWLRLVETHPVDGAELVSVQVFLGDPA